MSASSPRERLDAGSVVPAPTHRLVFVGGLHRSGTTRFAQWLAGHPDVSGFAQTGVTEDEGQFLQSVYPALDPRHVRLYPWADWTGLPARYGWFQRLPGRAGSDWAKSPGRFAFDPAAHFTEHSPLVSPANAERLLGSWGPYWDLERPVLVEKTPENIVRTRFLQALFPEASFIVVIRHPIAVSLATQKWSRTSLHALLRHWVRAHALLDADAPHIRRLLVLPYESLVGDPAGVAATVSEFLALSRPLEPSQLDPAYNDRYFDRWQRRRRSPLGAPYLRALEAMFDARTRRFGYAMRRPGVDARRWALRPEASVTA